MATHALGEKALSRVTRGIIIHFGSSVLFIGRIRAPGRTSLALSFLHAQLGVTLHFFRIADTHIRAAIMLGLAIRQDRPKSNHRAAASYNGR